ncbi:MAG: hypothetical protein M3063_13885 [Actinomycetota bacterium]|nr:hypothetical protein [Actinomycetota bacterium]
MRNVSRLILAVCVALVAAGVGGLIVHHGHTPVAASPRGSGTVATPTTPAGSGRVTAPSPTTTAPSVTVPSDATLQANLIIPNDLGGYYHPVPAESAKQWAGSGCLVPLGHPSGTARQAVQFLEGPYFGGLPLINEQLDAFPSVDAASSTYRSLAATLGACPAPMFAVYGNAVSVTLSPLPIAGLGDEAASVQGTYQLHGKAEQLTVAVVRRGSTIVVFAYADTVPASNKVLGDVTSTVRAAAGKAS